MKTEYIMNLTRRVVLTAAVGFFTNLTFAQSVQDGINFVDSQKYAKAKQNFTDLINQNPKDASNFFYLGNIYLTQFDPNFTEAQDSFNKGLALDPKSYLNKIGLASVKLGKGDRSAIAEIQQIVKDSKEKDEFLTTLVFSVRVTDYSKIPALIDLAEKNSIKNFKSDSYDKTLYLVEVKKNNSQKNTSIAEAFGVYDTIKKQLSNLGIKILFVVPPHISSPKPCPHFVAKSKSSSV